MKAMPQLALTRVDVERHTRKLAAGNSFCAILLVTLLACLPLLGAASEPPKTPAIVPPAAASPPDDGQWTMPAKNYASTRFSELSEINDGNVKNLQVAFTFSTGVNKGQEAAPLVVGNTMYIVTPFPNFVFALDLAKPGAPMKWKYEPNPEPAAQGVACCDVVNRGAAFSNGGVFFNTLDGHTIAVDVGTGQPVWNTKIGNINIGETITM